MERMAEQQRRLTEVREEQRRLRQEDRADNIERMLRAKTFHDAKLKEKFAAEDDREAERKRQKAQLVETHRMASLAATQQRQELVAKLAKARGREQLMKLSSSLSLASGGTSSCGGSVAGDLASSAPVTPRPPSTPRPSRPSTARARLA